LRRCFKPAPTQPPDTDAQVPGAYWFGLYLTVFDGTVLDLPATPENAAVFATPTGGSFPQARLVTLASCGTRRVLAAEADSSAVSEQHLVDQPATALRPGTLNPADRNFFAMHRWVAFAATDAHLAWRVKNGAKSLPAKILRALGDGPHLVRLHESQRSNPHHPVSDPDHPAGSPHLARVADRRPVRRKMAGRGRLLPDQSHPARCRSTATRREPGPGPARDLGPAHRLQRPL
jgi:hypothetical protein